MPTEAWGSLPKLDDEALKAAGVRKYEGRRLVLLTDSADPEMAKLPAAFDAGVDLWTKHFGLHDAPFQVQGHVMVDPQVFQRLGLWRGELANLRTGFAFPDAFWMMEQAGAEYYRRHLLLHEGVHCFTLTRFGGCGAPWYMEGTAELLATHRWSPEDGRLTVAYFPRSADETPNWGRVRLVREAMKRQPLSLGDVLNLPADAHLRNANYGWSWALAAFLDGHPKYQTRFRKLLPSDASDDDFLAAFQQLFADDLPTMSAEWRLFTSRLDYGYDLTREAVDFQAGKPWPAEKTSTSVSVQADRGWQSTGLLVETGRTYRLTASGRFQIAHTDRPWPCEANGVSIRYFAGRPLGQLLAAVQSPTDGESSTAGLLDPTPIGLSADFTPKSTGTLYLRLNDSPAELSDNAGSCRVEIHAPR